MIRRIAGPIAIVIPVLLVIGLAAHVLASRQTMLGAFTTSLEGRSPEQMHNIRRAAQSLDGLVIHPGEVFSFNAVTGECTAVRGYAAAPMIVRGQLEDGSGGGVCQVSSTLYNAALLAGMRIVERNPHSTPVSSVSPGRDATVLFGGSDLRVRNGFEEPVTIRSEASSSRLAIRLMGSIHPNPQYRLIVETTDAIHPVSAGQASGRTRDCTAVVWREKSVAGKVQYRELISSDTYKMLP